MSRAWAWRLRQLAGLAALGLLVAMGFATATWAPVRAPATVAASQTFRVIGDEPGHYAWTLESGRPPGGPGLLRQRALEFDRSEVIELSVPATLATGQAVAQDQVVAELGSERASRRLEQLHAQRDGLEAERALLVAGGRPEAIAAADRQVAVAQAKHDEDHAAFERLQSLAGTGAVSAEDLRASELRDESGARDVELARARLAEARVPPRPEEIAHMDARLAALDAQLGDTESRLSEQRVKTPIAGIVEVGGDALVRVYDVDPVYVRAALPESARARIVAGASVAFRSPALPGRAFTGRVAEIGESVSAGRGGQPVFYVTAEVANPDLALREGMSGSVELREDGWSGRLTELTGGALGL